MSDRTHICCPSHCCIDPSHGCKYGYEDCPVVLGTIKQTGLCEQCGLESEGYYGEPECTREQQQEYIDGLWEEKHNPTKLSVLEQAVAEIAKCHGRNRAIAILEAVYNLPFSEEHFNCEVPTTIGILKTLKAIK